MNAPAENLSRRVYNVTAMSFTPAELAVEIQKIYPEFIIDYQPDFRQAIAESWPESIDDSLARQDWDWNPRFDITKMTQDMISQLKQRL